MRYINLRLTYLLTYVGFRKDRVRGGGGVMVAVKETLPACDIVMCCVLCTNYLTSQALVRYGLSTRFE